MNPFVARVGAALMASNASEPSSMAVSFYDEAREYGPESELSWPLENGIASRLISIGATNHSICAVARHRNHPLIVLGHASYIAGTTSIVPDYPGAARLALGMLARHGHRHVGIVGGPFSNPEPRFAELVRGIADAAQEVGIETESHDLYEGAINVDRALEALFSTLGQSFAPTALLCLTEAVATAILTGAHARGIPVPGRLSVIALADREAVAPACLPLTTVVLPADEMAATAVREAGRQLRSGCPSDARKIIVDVKLIERATCGPANAACKNDEHAHL
jgi:DNA-binding LacI/PurR family transcriptional regulator